MHSTLRGFEKRSAIAPCPQSLSVEGHTMLSVVSGRVDPSRHLVMALSADHPRESRASHPCKILLGLGPRS